MLSNMYLQGLLSYSIEAKFIDFLIDDILLNKPIDELVQKKRIKALRLGIDNELEKLLKAIFENKNELELYITTSLSGINYLEKIEENIFLIKNCLNVEDNGLLNYLDNLSKACLEYENLVNNLVLKFEQFSIQTKDSLEWNYSTFRKSPFDFSSFKKKINNLGGQINVFGSHFDVEYTFFKHRGSIAKKGKSNVDVGTLNGAITRAFNFNIKVNEEKVQRIESFGTNVDRLNDYYQCYLFAGVLKFDDLFVDKYKSLFSNV